MSSSSPQTLNDNDHPSSYSTEVNSNQQQQQQPNNNNNMNGSNNNGGGGGGSSMNNNNNNNNNNNEPSIKTELNESCTGGGSSSNENNNNNSNNSQDDVCRDFLRNVCRRGKSCRYKHPDGSDPELLKNKEQFVFCHDFQNRECRRDNCRFLHCTKQEEEMYRTTGRLPPHIQAQIQNDDRLSAPICKDFLHGTCRRGHRCKYRHPDYHSSNNRNGPPPVQSPFDGRNGGRGGAGGGGGGGVNYSMSNNSHNPMDYQSPYSGRGSQMMPSSNYGYNDNYTDTPPNKRKRYDPGNIYHENSGPYPGAYNEPPPPNMRGTQSGGGYGVSSPSQPYYGAPRAAPMESRYLEEENAALRRRIDDLKKQLSEYMSTNEYLLEQLNQYRASNPAATSLQQQQPPPGSVASTGAVQMSAPITLQTTQVTPQQAAAVAIGPLPPVSIVSSIASISLPTVSAPVTLVNSSAAASLASFTPSMHSSNPWPLGVDQ